MCFFFLCFFKATGLMCMFDVMIKYQCDNKIIIIVILLWVLLLLNINIRQKNITIIKFK